METLRQLRNERGLTQAELADASGLRQATLSAIENGQSRPHLATMQSIAGALGVDAEQVKSAVNLSHRGVGEGDVAEIISRVGDGWRFLHGLDSDLRVGLAQSLVAEWTHSSTALEGNTITAGDTLFVLTEGLTISGKSLREHQELHGHAHALALMSSWADAEQPIRITSLHDLHRAVQTGTVIDALAPLGAWKVESNGTMAIQTNGKTTWHEYASPRHVPKLIELWLRSLSEFQQKLKALVKTGSSEKALNRQLIESYTDIHLGFVAIHPYADGNGRMARLLANIPLLKSGYPPLLVGASSRRDYLTLLGDYSIRRGQPLPSEALVRQGKHRNAIRDFFTAQWQETRDLVEKFHQRQALRGQ